MRGGIRPRRHALKIAPPPARHLRQRQTRPCCNLFSKNFDEQLIAKSILLKMEHKSNLLNFFNICQSLLTINHLLTELTLILVRSILVTTIIY